MASFMSASDTVPFGLSSMKVPTISAGKWQYEGFPTKFILALMESIDRAKYVLAHVGRESLFKHLTTHGMKTNLSGDFGGAFDYRKRAGRSCVHRNIACVLVSRLVQTNTRSTRACICIT